MLRKQKTKLHNKHNWKQTQKDKPHRKYWSMSPEDMRRNKDQPGTPQEDHGNETKKVQWCWWSYLEVQDT